MAVYNGLLRKSRWKKREVLYSIGESIEVSRYYIFYLTIDQRKVRQKDIDCARQGRRRPIFWSYPTPHFDTPWSSRGTD